MLNVVCLKYGDKYGPIYVNNLYNMIERHLTVPHRFVCFTDNTLELNPKIEIKLIQSQRFSGWWWKPYIFKADHFSDGDTNLFFDLDMVIVNNIDNIANYLPNDFVGLQDVGRVFKRGADRLGSAVLKWPANQYTDIWTNLDANPNYARQFQGDQDYIWNLHKSVIRFFPEKWIQSYKWEIRDRSELVRINGRFNFDTIKDVQIDKETNVLAFHGSPDPHEVKDPIIVDNWQ